MLDHEETVNGRLRRYYRLTDAATQVLAEDAERMAAQASATSARLSARGVRRGATSGGMA